MCVSLVVTVITIIRLLLTVAQNVLHATICSERLGIRQGLDLKQLTGDLKCSFQEKCFLTGECECWGC